MGFFRNLFGKGDVPPPVSTKAALSSAVAPREIAYDPNLIDALLRDHAELGRIFKSIGEAQIAAKFEEIPSLLVSFKSRLESHVLTENVRFYNYLEKSLATDSDNTEVMLDFRREMNTIARSVIEFVKKYQQSGFAADERLRFSTDYQAVGKILEQRLDSEEDNLYPLYRAH